MKQRQKWSLYTKVHYICWALPLGFSSNVNYAVVILHDGKQIILNFKFSATNEDDFDSKEIQTSTNSSILMKMHNLLELSRNQPSVLWLWIGCSSSCFKYRGLYITTVDLQMIQAPLLLQHTFVFKCAL